MLSPDFFHARIALPLQISSKSSVARYGMTLLATAAAVILTHLLWSWIDPAVSLIFFIAILFISWQAGLRPGLLCCLLSALLCNYFFVGPVGFDFGADDLLRISVFMLAAVFINALTIARAEAEETKDQIRQQLAVTLKSIGDAIITTDARGKVTFMNSVAQSLTGWPESEARGLEVHRLFSLIDPQSRNPVDGVVPRVLRDQVVIALGSSVLMTTRDGTEVPVTEIAAPVRDNGGGIGGVVLVLRNVTQLAVDPTDQQLLNQQIALLESVDTATYAVDAEGRCLFVNKVGADLLDFRADDLVGRDLHEILHCRNGAFSCDNQTCPTHAALLGKSSSSGISETVWGRTGVAVSVEVSTAPMLIGEKPLGSVITITDLTDRHLAQDAMLRLHSIVDEVSEAVVTHTVEGIITSWNQSAERLFGYSVDEVLGRHISIIHAPGRKQELDQLFERIARGERITPFETVRIAKGGECCQVSVKASLLRDSHGMVTGVSQIIGDLKTHAESEALHPSRYSESGSHALAENSSRSRQPRNESFGERRARFGKPSREPQAVRRIVGRSLPMQKLMSTIQRIGPTDSSILITGATGTGKELIARAVHEHSLRASGPFVDINCSAIPETLIEAELFGHQKGTFTGAHEHRPGLFELACGGTLFLDEVDALPLAAQAKLLRVVQERRVRRIGGRNNIAVDVRIISASNSDLQLAINENRFRADLFYRLRVVPLQVPELCQREGDIELLVEYFLDRHTESTGQPIRSVTPEAMKALLEYPWPGNVRELENALEYALALSTERTLRLEDLPTEVITASPDGNDLKRVIEAYLNDSVPLAEIEKRYILSVLHQFGGNQVKAAAALGIDRSKLYRRLKQYGVMAVKFLQEEEQDGLQFRGVHAAP